jgi:hypothetical protein
MFLAGWLLHSIRLAAALGLALVAMQAPAVTREYQAALLQLVRSSDEEIAQRKASAQRFYGIAPGEDEGRFLAQLRAVEPSNAETLAAAFDRQRSLRASYERIVRCARLLPPRMSPRMKEVVVVKLPRRCSTALRRSSICPLLPPTASSACSSARLKESYSWPPSCLGIALPARGKLGGGSMAGRRRAKPM